MTVREAVRGALLGGAISSAAIMLFAGRANQHLVTSVGFVGWVLAPFVVLAFAEAKSNYWPTAMQTTLHAVALIVTAATLALYVRRIYHPPAHQPAAVFTLVPPASVVFIFVALGIAKLVSRPAAAQSPHPSES